MAENEPKVNLRVTQKVNLGNYQSAEVQAHITDLPFNADEVTLSIAQATMDEGIKRMIASLRDNIRTIRKESREDEEPEVF